MARRWTRRRGAEPGADAPAGDTVETVHLDTADHAWWAQEEVRHAWRPPPRRAEPEPPRDILAEHFGPDWRTNFFTPTPDPGPAIDEPVDRDPYEVLEIEPTASWDEIIAAHRHQARVHHPDLLFGQSEEEKAESEERLRVINAAYRELRIRRGM
jgi:DnaJ-domain-containing protein 1